MGSDGFDRGGWTMEVKARRAGGLSESLDGAVVDLLFALGAASVGVEKAPTPGASAGRVPLLRGAGLVGPVVKHRKRIPSG